jgi:hypothetical protein
MAGQSMNKNSTDPNLAQQSFPGAQRRTRIESDGGVKNREHDPM